MRYYKIRQKNGEYTLWRKTAWWRFWQQAQFAISDGHGGIVYRLWHLYGKDDAVTAARNTVACDNGIAKEKKRRKEEKATVVWKWEEME
jgi:hypothetical protein